MKIAARAAIYKPATDRCDRLVGAAETVALPAQSYTLPLVVANQDAALPGLHLASGGQGMRIPKGSIALMDDRHAQFLILLEEVCASAQLASLRVELHTTEGATIGGVPRATSPAGEIDDTGCHHTVRIDADEVALQEVVNFTVAAPERPPAAMADVHRRRPFLPESVH